LRAQSTAADISEPQTPGRSNGGDVGEPFSRTSPTPAAVKDDDDDRATSPVSTASSASEPPLAQKVKMNGNHTTTKRPTTPMPTSVPVVLAPSTPVKHQSLDLPTSNTVAPPSSGPAAAATTTSPSRTSVRCIE
jgi:SWI/SNF-related matrix-associated actin-dependent regulator of chromatin subfamily B protein 1